MVRRMIKVEINEEVYQWLSVEAEIKQSSSPADYAAQLLTRIYDTMSDNRSLDVVDEGSTEGEAVAEILRSLGYM